MKESQPQRVVDAAMRIPYDSSEVSSPVVADVCSAYLSIVLERHIHADGLKEAASCAPVMCAQSPHAAAEVGR